MSCCKSSEPGPIAHCVPYFVIFGIFWPPSHSSTSEIVEYQRWWGFSFQKAFMLGRFRKDSLVRECEKSRKKDFSDVHMFSASQQSDIVKSLCPYVRYSISFDQKSPQPKAGTISWNVKSFAEAQHGIPRAVPGRFLLCRGGIQFCWSKWSLEWNAGCLKSLTGHMFLHSFTLVISKF